MHKKKKPIIGYFHQTIAHDWGNLPWQGIIKTANRHQVNSISFIGHGLNSSSPLVNQSDIVYELAKGEYLDGVVIWNGQSTYDSQENQIGSYINHFKGPKVILENYNTIPDCTRLLCANRDGIILLMNHLYYTHGYKKIGFMGQDPGYVGFQIRYEAYIDSLKSLGLKLDPALVGPWVEWFPQYNGRSHNDCLDEWIPKALEAGMEALVCLADPVAWWVIKRMNLLGIQVPDDVAVVGFDGFTDSKLMNPPLTTVDPLFEGSGVFAINTVMDLLEKKSHPEKLIVPPELFIGRTCGCFKECEELDKRFHGYDMTSRGDILRKLGSILPNEQGFEVEELYSAFIDEKNYIDRAKISFLQLLEFKLKKYVKLGISLTPQWQEAITCLNNCAVEAEKITPKHSLCHQARILINNASVRQQGDIRNRSVHQAVSETTVSSQILNNFKLSNLCDVLADNLPEIGIRRCYLALFDEPFDYRFPDSLPKQARLVLAFNETSRQDLGPKGQLKPTFSIIPDIIELEQGASNWVVFSLHFGEKQIGFVVFLGMADTGRTCEYLKAFISRSLQGIFLISNKTKAVQNLEEAKARLQTELKIAQNIQKALVPEIPEHHLFDISAVLEPSFARGSNFYDFHHKNNHDWFIIGDVHGQGIYAGLVMLMIQNTSRLLIKNSPNILPYQLVRLVGEVIQDNTTKLDVRKGMTLGIIKHIGNGVFQCSGTMLSLLIFRNKNGEIEKFGIETIECGNVNYDTIYQKESHFVLLPGDSFLVYTQGLLNGLRETDRAFTMEYLVQLFLSSAHKNADSITQNIIKKIDNNALDEDVTLLVVKWPLK